MNNKQYELEVRTDKGVTIQTTIDPAWFIVPREGERFEAQGPRQWVGGTVLRVKHVHDLGACVDKPRLIIRLEPAEVKDTPEARGPLTKAVGSIARALKPPPPAPDPEDAPGVPKIKRRRPSGPTGGKAA